MMNEFKVMVYDTNGDTHGYYVQTEQSRKEIIDDVNFALNNGANIQINYYKEGKEGTVLFNNKKVMAVNIMDYKEEVDINNRTEEKMEVTWPVKPGKLVNVLYNESKGIVGEVRE